MAIRTRGAQRSKPICNQLFMQSACPLPSPQSAGNRERLWLHPAGLATKVPARKTGGRKAAASPFLGPLLGDRLTVGFTTAARNPGNPDLPGSRLQRGLPKNPVNTSATLEAERDCFREPHSRFWVAALYRALQRQVVGGE